MPFFYEKWDVFQAALRLRQVAQELSRFQTPGTASDLDNLRRASASCVSNLAEGARELHAGKKLDRYGTTRSSASECNGSLISLEALMPPEAMDLLNEGKDVADRVSAMTTNLIRSVQRRRNSPSDPPKPRPR